jgi:hypothetical protein
MLVIKNIDAYLVVQTAFHSWNEELPELQLGRRVREMERFDRWQSG